MLEIVIDKNEYQQKQLRVLCTRYRYYTSRILIDANEYQESNSEINIQDICTVHRKYLSTRMNTGKVTPYLIYEMRVLYVANT